jgi:hypothetical protein
MYTVKNPMKKVVTTASLLLLPFSFIADLVIFLSTAKNVSCLSCDLSHYLKTSSMSIHLVSNAFATIQNHITKK